MLYNFNGNLVNVADIVTVITSNGQNPTYPFVLTVTMRNGQHIAVNFRTDADRRREINQIARSFELSVETPVSRYELETIVEKYIKKVRADLQPLKKFAKENAENG